ncbi:hypothetical protein [Chitiniphilus eburneus]|uniref:Calcium-binding protein n=1 Tax=Chitiniphilus eburneus TaxID=2571148 RepID=A0A4U0Q1J0_9NEIS|nr:hypothetical protein [Chitiniphilus eburneus]TJZ74817.1 hypothetical protein FAZ21_07550 [Chitiniphilus eburneus]
MTEFNGRELAADGLLVLDRNRNGRIDNSRELFGDATPKSDGTATKDGFDAPADLDSNQDGEAAAGCAS